VEDFPAPDQLWHRQRVGLGLANNASATKLLTPGFPDPARPLRYYQESAVNRTLQAITTGQQRSLLTLCTWAGKTAVAFQISWRLWSSDWNKRRGFKKPKILFLADRNVLVDDPMSKTFAPFGDARYKIENGEISKGSLLTNFRAYPPNAGNRLQKFRWKENAFAMQRQQHGQS
jgi:type I restriction enzyme R subunit